MASVQQSTEEKAGLEAGIASAVKAAEQRKKANKVGYLAEIRNIFGNHAG